MPVKNKLGRQMEIERREWRSIEWVLNERICESEMTVSCQRLQTDMGGHGL